EIGALENQRIVMLGAITAPDVEWIDAEPLRERVRRKCRAAWIRTHQPDRGWLRYNPVALPLSLDRRVVHHSRRSFAAAQRHEPNAPVTGGRRVDDRGLAAADSLDIRREKLRRLSDAGCLAVVYDDVRYAGRTCQRYGVLCGCTGPDPGPAQRRRPGSVLRGRSDGQREQEHRTHHHDEPESTRHRGPAQRFRCFKSAYTRRTGRSSASAPTNKSRNCARRSS